MSAFSFSKSKKQSSFVKFDKDVPNVGKYNLSETKFNSRIKSSPSVSLGKASRDTPQKKQVPGPGAYQIMKILQKNTGGVTIKGSHEFKIKTQGPSPGQYDPKVQFPTKKYSFSKSKQKLNKSQGPDPTTYNANFAIMNKTSNYVFSKAQQRQPFDKREWTKNIGPGCHNVKDDLLIEQKDKYSFPKKQKFKQDTLQIKQKTLIPGPGKYDLGNARQSHKFAKFSIASKSIIQKQEVPGPGTYKIAQKLDSKSGIAIGKQTRQINYKGLAPGPGSYEIQNQIKIKSKQTNVVFTRDKRLKSQTNTIDLGPGQYEIQDQLSRIKKRNKGYSIKGRTIIQKIQHTPGPQAYNPDYKKVHSSCQRPIIGKQRKLSLRIDQVPGPGAYVSKQKQFSKTFYFNKSNSRSLEIKKSKQSLGPGQYKLKPFIGQFLGKDKLNLKIQTLYV